MVQVEEIEDPWLFRDDGLVNMTWDVYSSTSFALVSQLDRAWMSVTLGKVQLTAGRQRVNWGQAIVWNPKNMKMENDWCFMWLRDEMKFSVFS